jgi:hypothetical protein
MLERLHLRQFAQEMGFPFFPIDPSLVEIFPGEKTAQSEHQAVSGAAHPEQTLFLLQSAIELT